MTSTYSVIPSPRLCHVNVEFSENLTFEQIYAQIGELTNPQIILWYIGPYGLKQHSATYYKDNLINPIRKYNTEATFWLVDLTAWGAFKSEQYSIQSVSSCCDVIDQFRDANIKCIRSAHIFKKMQSVRDTDIIEYFNKSLKRDFIHNSSKSFCEKNILVRDIFSENCPLMAEWYDHDVAKSYSTFQYLEGCLLVDEIVEHLLTEKNNTYIQVVFALPNDEIKYYKDDFCSFQEDLRFLISKKYQFLDIENINLHIKFISFNYGTELHHRPYNAPGRVLKKRNFSYQHVFSHSEENIGMKWGNKYATKF